jgi:serine/threonine protein kinase
MAHLAPGKLVGRYRLDAFLGEGGMGIVWSATHLGTSERVALKMLRTAAASPDARRRALREARVACALEHPHILPVLEVFESSEGTPVLVMKLLHGETLATRLSRVEALSLPEVAKLVLPVTSAVGTAHQLGVVHRDLKPENIFLARNVLGMEEVLVLDFGVAKLTAREGPAAATAALTSTGAIIGTPRYMAPEQAVGSKHVDHRADIWALGLVIYEALGGAPAIDGANMMQVLKNVLHAAIVPLDQLVNDLPPDVTQTVMAMLQRDPFARPADLRPVRDVLYRYTNVRPADFGPALAQ